MSNKFKSILIILFCFLPIPAITLSQITTVQNPFRERETKWGETYQDVINIKNPNTHSTNVKIYKLDFFVQRDGNNTYLASGQYERSNANWIKFSPSQIIIPPETTADIQCTVTVPKSKSLSGSYWSMVVAEEISDNFVKTDSLQSSVFNEASSRAHRIYFTMLTHIENSGNGVLKYLSSELTKDEAKETLRIHLKNIGDRLLKPTIWADIYDEMGHFIDRFQGERFVCYPMTTVTYKIDLSKVSTGQYKALIAGQGISWRSRMKSNTPVFLMASLDSLKLSGNQQKSQRFVEAPKHSKSTEKSNVFTNDMNFSRVASISGSGTAVNQEPQDENYSLAESIPDYNFGKKRLLKSKIIHEMSDRVSKNQSVKNQTKENVYYYLVQPGDWLSKIAKRFYGNALKFKQIYEANQDILSDPNQIYPGQKIRIPNSTNPTDYYLVKTGDWLSKIARRYYGNFKKYNIIFDANRTIIKDPNLIFPGQQLRIPLSSQLNTQQYNKANDILSDNDRNRYTSHTMGQRPVRTPSSLLSSPNK